MAKAALSVEQTYTLVGEFMASFAYLESELNRSVERLLGLGTLEGSIVTANIMFGAKANILLVAAQVKSAQGVAWTEAAVRDIEKVAKMGTQRNIIAHNMFGPDPNGSVRFLMTKAKNKLEFPDELWSPERFREAKTKMAELVKRLREISDTIMPDRDAIVNALMSRGPAGMFAGSPLRGGLASLLSAGTAGAAEEE